MKNGNRKTYTSILDEASNWFVEFSEGEVDPAAKEAFVRWLRTSPEHVRAYLEISALWEDASSIDKSRSREAGALVALALGEENVVPLIHASAGPQGVPARTGKAPGPIASRDLESRAHEQATVRSAWRSTVTYAAAACSALILAIAAGWVFIHERYSTDIGEQRLIALSDGSSVELNARSRIRVHFTATERTVYLLDGEALFHAAHDVSRPFIVQSDNLRVRAVGTAFDVYRRKGDTTVTVVEGRVSVLDNVAARSGLDVRKPDALDGPERSPVPARPAAGLLLAAGEQITLRATAPAPGAARAASAPRSADVSAATAWTQGRLVFNSSPLAEVVDQYNRYNTRPLTVRDPALATLQISGVFSVADSASLIAFLDAQPGVHVQQTAAGLEITAQ